MLVTQQDEWTRMNLFFEIRKAHKLTYIVLGMERGMSRVHEVIDTNCFARSV